MLILFKCGKRRNILKFIFILGFVLLAWQTISKTLARFVLFVVQYMFKTFKLEFHNFLLPECLFGQQLNCCSALLYDNLLSITVPLVLFPNLLFVHSFCSIFSNVLIYVSRKWVSQTDLGSAFLLK